mmetsp:Transcript_53455/g.159965  ORF Transcript_53455/g.159965 Transcript_53455/m.159965 type:complete len:85 (+) Transcript_53455:380-634(+)
MECALQYFWSLQRCSRRCERSFRPVRIPFGLPILLFSGFEQCYRCTTKEMFQARQREEVSIHENDDEGYERSVCRGKFSRSKPR